MCEKERGRERGWRGTEEERGRESVEQTNELGLAFLQWPVESVQCGGPGCSLLVDQWFVCGRDHLLQPNLVRLFLGVDEMEEEFLTEFKLMILLAVFYLTLFSGNMS